MNSKTPLLLMEQILMLLVFAITAAFCLRAFVLADFRSAENAARDRAVVEAQSAAEYYKAFMGDAQESAASMEGYEKDGLLCVDYDATWEPCEEGASETAYRLRIQPEATKQALLGKAALRVETSAGVCLIAFPVAYQRGGVGG